MVDTAVALFVFNRPQLTQQVFDAIRAARPSTLLVVADGPRPTHPDDVEKCAAARAAVADVDWPCDVRREYSETNLSCGVRMATGLTWVFEQVPAAIILEDDCRPAADFFTFCHEMLNRYEHDTRIMHICGSNFQFGAVRGEHSHYYSKYSQIWGWATWRRAWRHYDFHLRTWPTAKAAGHFQAVWDSPGEEYYWTGVFDGVAGCDQPTCWSYAWQYAVWANHGLAVTPNVNLISNLGDGEDATHTAGVSNIIRLPVGELPGPYDSPRFVVRNLDADRHVFDHYYPGRYLRPVSFVRQMARRVRSIARRWQEQAFGVVQ